jgi:hypothetical protein
VPIEPLPEAPRADAGDAAVAPDAEAAGDAWLYAEPPGLVEGAAAESLRASAAGAVITVDEETDVLSFVPLEASGGEAVRLSPETLAGWGSGPAHIGLAAFNPAEGAAFLLRGGPRVIHRIAVSVTTPLKSAPRPQVDTAAQGLATAVPVNGLYRVGLDGRDADTPQPLVLGVAFTGEPLRSEATHQFFVKLGAGLAVLPDTAPSAPRLFRPDPPETRYEIIGLSDAAGLLVFTESRVSSNGLSVLSNVWSLPLADLEAEPTLVHRPPALEAGGFSRSVTRLDDRWYLVHGGGEPAAVIDAQGEVRPVPLAVEPMLDARPRVVQDQIVYAGSVEVPDRFDQRALLAQTLTDRAMRSPNVLDSGENLDPTPAAVDAQGEHLVFGEPEGARVVRLDGGAASLLTVPADRTGTGEVGFSPDGRTVLIVTAGADGLGVEALPRSGAAGRTLVSPDATIFAIDLAGVENRGHFVVLRQVDDQATLVRVGLDGTAEPPVALPGRRPSLQVVPGGVVVRTKAGRRHVDAKTPSGLEPLYTPRGADESLTMLTPDGRYALVHDDAPTGDRPGAAVRFAVDLLNGGPPKALTSRDGDDSLEALRSDAAVVSRSVGAASELRWVPLAQGLEGARPYDTGGGVFSQDLPGLGGVALVLEEQAADSRILLFAPDSGEAPSPIATLPATQVIAVRAVPEPRALVALVRESDPGGTVVQSLIRWPLGPGNAPDGEPTIVSVPGLEVQTLDDLPAPGTYLVSGLLDNVPGLWRLAFDATPEDRFTPLAQPGLNVPAASIAIGGTRSWGYFDEAGAGHALDAERTVLLAAGLQVFSGGLSQRPLFVVHLDGRDREGVAPLVDGRAVEEGTASMAADGRHILFATAAHEVELVATRPEDPSHRLGRTSFIGLLRQWPDGTMPPLAYARGGGRSFVFLDDTAGELAVIRPEDGARDVRVSFPPPPSTGWPEVLRLTPDERAAVVAYSGPTGRRLYLVSLEGEPGVARLVADDTPADEELLTFRP